MHSLSTTAVVVVVVGMVRFATRTLTLTIFRNRSDDSGSTLTQSGAGEKGILYGTGYYP
jgi:hypothetical protein